MMRWIGLVILFGMTACAPWVDDAHHRMIHDAQDKLGSLEEGFKWDRREIIDLRRRVEMLEKCGGQQ